MLEVFGIALICQTETVREQRSEEDHSLLILCFRDLSSYSGIGRVRATLWWLVVLLSTLERPEA